MVNRDSQGRTIWLEAKTEYCNISPSDVEAKVALFVIKTALEQNWNIVCFEGDHLKVINALCIDGDDLSLFGVIIDEQKTRLKSLEMSLSLLSRGKATSLQTS
ncbi:hypothetical protein CDL12_29700 [Handroanthus impetiginosus]|uniref:RNase H type-1 domain-containing protein n=1 Tax=Handroanthus impetiginosus TaxID=429701 RepID=A0A2G9FXN5_9LAMI|nr:hypothetical protein CDL12_29700 [Handroanthus impetiginosus]